MRLRNFRGLELKTPDQNLEQYQAAFAENVDFRGGDSIKPWPALEHLADLVDINGKPFKGTPATIHQTEGVWVAFDEFVTISLDPRNRAGAGSFLFVQDGKVWRSSARWILDGDGPQQVGMSPPNKPPKVSVDKGANPNPEKMPNNTCGVIDYRDDCHDLPPEPRAYLKTYVNCMGEESAPSPLSEPVDVLIGDAVVLMDEESHPENADKVCYYRTVVDSKGETQILFLASRDVESAGFVDKKSSLELGNALATEAHYPPPRCAEGIVDMGDNLVAVWSGREFWVSEPLMPHAYTNREVYAVDENIVRCFAVRPGTQARVEFYVYILTEGKPYMFNKARGAGSGPSAQQGKYGPDPFYINEPCVSPQGVTEMDGAVVYCSPNGLIALSGGQTESLLDSVATEREWRDWVPHETALAYYRGLLVGFNRQRCWLFTAGQYVKERSPELSTLSTVPSTAFSRPSTGMVFGFPSPNGSAYVSRFDGQSNQLMTGTWRSSEFAMPGWWEPAAMKVVADYPRIPRKCQQAKRELQTWRRHKGVSLDAFIAKHPEYSELRPFLESSFAPVIVRVYCDGHLYYERAVSNNDPFRIPHKYYGINWQLEVVTQAEVQEIQAENSIESLTKFGEGVGNSLG